MNDKYRADLFAKSLYKENSRLLRWKDGMSASEREEWVKAIKAKATELMEFPDTAYDNPNKHYYKFETAVPWLIDALGHK